MKCYKTNCWVTLLGLEPSSFRTTQAWRPRSKQPLVPCASYCELYLHCCSKVQETASDTETIDPTAAQQYSAMLRWHNTLFYDFYETYTFGTRRTYSFHQLLYATLTHVKILLLIHFNVLSVLPLSLTLFHNNGNHWWLIVRTFRNILWWYETYSAKQKPLLLALCMILLFTVIKHE